MTLGDIIKGALKTDLYELLIWSSWYFRESRVSCKECIEVRAISIRAFRESGFAFFEQNFAIKQRVN